MNFWSQKPPSSYPGLKDIGEVLRPRLEPGSIYLVITVSPGGHAELVSNLTPDDAVELLRDVAGEMVPDPLDPQRN